jgi:leader peptidase (prepilin peptidase)/N-methyltransferase
MYLAAAFILGAIVGSFLNVCAIRVPVAESIVSPRSHCRSCKKPIRWYDNIPCVSYFLLAGHCRDCHARISPQYAFVEFVTGFLFMLFYGTFGISVRGVVYLAVSLALFTGSLIDLKHRIIPDSITLTGIVAGLVLSAIFPSLQEQSTWKSGLFQSFLGMIAGGGFLYVTATLVEFFAKKEAMGGGDVKLLAMIGAFLGWQGAFWTIFVSSVSGSIIGLFYRLVKGEETLAYGPHIAFAAFLYFFVGHDVVQRYVNSIVFLINGFRTA